MTRFQRGVEEDVATERAETDEGRERVDAEDEQEGAGEREERSPAEREVRVEAAGGERSVRGPPHQAVDVAFQDLVERQRAGGEQRGADRGLHEAREIDLRAAREHETGGRGEGDHRRDPRLGQHQEIGDAQSNEGERGRHDRAFFPGQDSTNRGKLRRLAGFCALRVACHDPVLSGSPGGQFHVGSSISQLFDRSSNAFARTTMALGGFSPVPFWPRTRRDCFLGPAVRCSGC